MRRIRRKRVLLGALAVALVVGGALLIYRAHRRVRERQLDALVMRVCGDDRAAHEAAAAFADALSGADEAERRDAMRCIGLASDPAYRAALGDEIVSRLDALWREDLRSDDPAAHAYAVGLLDFAEAPDLEDLVWEMRVGERDETVRIRLRSALVTLTLRRIRERHDRENGYE